MKGRRLVLGLAAALAAGAAAAWLWWPRDFIPANIRQELTSTLFVPSGSQITVDHTSAKYDTKLNLLTYRTTAYSKAIVMSEEPTPDSFTDIPDLYTKLVAGMHEYKQFDTQAGTVHLTRPPEQNGRQVGVLNAAGTLVFAKSQSDLSDDQWRRFFGGLKVVQ